METCQSNTHTWLLLVTGLKEEVLLPSNNKVVLTLIRMGEGLLRFNVLGDGLRVLV